MNEEQDTTVTPSQEELVRKLHERWRDLGLWRSSVEVILSKRGLSSALAQPNADWSTVDIAVVQDMLDEATV